jgi:hypothetical protein
MVKHIKRVGSRAEVVHGSAKQTSGGLSKHDLIKNPKTGRIVSRRKHLSAKRENRLRKYGYGTKKGHFGSFRLTRKKGKRGGYASNSFSPASIDEVSVGKPDTSMSGNGIAGAGVTDFEQQGSIGVQLRSGATGGKRCKTRRGGYAGNAFAPMSLSGDGIDGTGITDYQGSVGLQTQAGMAGGKRRRRRKHRGGTPYGSSLDPMPLSGGRRKTRRHRRRHRGGMAPSISNAMDISGEGYKSDPNSVQVQVEAGLGN